MHSATTTSSSSLSLQQRIQSITLSDYVDSMKDITIVVLVIWFITAILELWSIEYVRKLRKQQPGLYKKAILYNILNPILIGIPLYPIAPLLFCYRCDGDDDDEEEINFTMIDQILQVSWIIVTHSIQYYYLHKLFHLNSKLYKHVHSFHHKFNTYTIPSSGNAVTLIEFLIAYLGPVLLSTILYPSSLQRRRMMQMHPSSLIISVYILQITHLLVHTPTLETISSIKLNIYF